MIGVLQVLDEIQAGIFDGMTYAEIEQNMPEEFAARKADKLGYRCVSAGPIDLAMRRDRLTRGDQNSCVHLVSAHAGFRLGKRRSILADLQITVHLRVRQRRAA